MKPSPGIDSFPRKMMIPFFFFLFQKFIMLFFSLVLKKSFCHSITDFFNPPTIKSAQGLDVSELVGILHYVKVCYSCNCFAIEVVGCTKKWMIETFKSWNRLKIFFFLYLCTNCKERFWRLMNYVYPTLLFFLESMIVSRLFPWDLVFKHF